jgi:hypothetical protein
MSVNFSGLEIEHEKIQETDQLPKGVARVVTARGF